MTPASYAAAGAPTGQSRSDIAGIPTQNPTQLLPIEPAPDLLPGALLGALYEFKAEPAIQVGRAPAPDESRLWSIDEQPPGAERKRHPLLVKPANAPYGTSEMVKSVEV